MTRPPVRQWPCLGQSEILECKTGPERAIIGYSHSCSRHVLQYLREPVPSRRVSIWAVCAFLVAALVVITCSNSTEPKPPHVVLEGLDLEAEGLEIQAAAISQMLTYGPGAIYAIRDSTAEASWYAISTREEFVSREMPQLADETKQDYNTQNPVGSRHAISSELNLEGPYLLLPDEETVNLGPDAFDEKYPNSGGFIGLSRVGFGPTSGQAVVYVEWYCGVTCGTGRLIQFDFVAGEWAMADSRNLWYSKK